MQDKKAIDDAPTDGTEIFAWFPMIGTWEVCMAEITEMFGLAVPVWVDRYGDTFETADGDLDSPTFFYDMPEDVV